MLGQLGALEPGRPRLALLVLAPLAPFPHHRDRYPVAWREGGWPGRGRTQRLQRGSSQGIILESLLKAGRQESGSAYHLGLPAGAFGWRLRFGLSTCESVSGGMPSRTAMAIRGFGRVATPVPATSGTRRARNLTTRRSEDRSFGPTAQSTIRRRWSDSSPMAARPSAESCAMPSRKASAGSSAASHR